jgi:hypothetical protein
LVGGLCRDPIIDRVIRSLDRAQSQVPLVSLEGDMTGLNEYYARMMIWCGNDDFLLAACNLTIGFLPAFTFGYLCFRAAKLFIADGADPLSGLHFATLFATATWGHFLILLSGKPAMFSLGLAAFQTVAILGIFIAPLSIVAGIPAVLIYAFRRPPLRARAVYFTAASILMASYLLAAFSNRAFRDSS